MLIMYPLECVQTKDSSGLCAALIADRQTKARVVELGSLSLGPKPLRPGQNVEAEADFAIDLCP